MFEMVKQTEIAKLCRLLMDVFCGYRGRFSNPFGHIWAFATPKKDMSEEELEKAAREAFENMGKND